jgi:hypothetical protein
MSYKRKENYKASMVGIMFSMVLFALIAILAAIQNLLA